MSDTMPHDIEWVLNEMCDGANKSLNGGDPDPILCKYGQKWKDFVKDSIWTIHSDAFWTYPHDFRYTQSLIQAPHISNTFETGQNLGKIK